MGRGKRKRNQTKDDERQMKRSADRLTNELGFDFGHFLEPAHRRGIEAERKGQTEADEENCGNRERSIDRLGFPNLPPELSRSSGGEKKTRRSADRQGKNQTDSDNRANAGERSTGALLGARSLLPSLRSGRASPRGSKISPGGIADEGARGAARRRLLIGGNRDDRRFGRPRSSAAARIRAAVRRRIGSFLARSPTATR